MFFSHRTQKDRDNQRTGRSIAIFQVPIAAALMTTTTRSLVLSLLLNSALLGWLQPPAKQKSMLFQVESYIQVTPLHPIWGRRQQVAVTTTSLTLRRRNENGSSSGRASNGDDKEVQGNGFPQLPPIGSSSLPKDFVGADPKPFVANHKFQLQYTCNICETRNHHNVSRLAYRQGVVITRCKGCDNRHLIADHLGWTDHEGGFQGNTTNTIEDYFADDANVQVNRVSSEVFALEKILSYNSKSGAIIGDDGKLAME
jgi:DNL zinc finger